MNSALAGVGTRFAAVEANAPKKRKLQRGLRGRRHDAHLHRAAAAGPADAVHRGLEP
jgi:hypothetical protein